MSEYSCQSRTKALWYQHAVSWLLSLVISVDATDAILPASKASSRASRSATRRGRHSQPNGESQLDWKLGREIKILIIVIAAGVHLAK